MYTVEDIRTIGFTKKGKNAYMAGEVDDFIDQCGDTVEKLMKDNAELTEKLQVIANKLVEYRNDEDSLRMALMTAQKTADAMVAEAKKTAETAVSEANTTAQKLLADATAKAETTVSEANAKAEKTVNDADAKAKQVLGDIAQDMETEKVKLERAKREVSQFKSRILSLYKEHISLLQMLPDDTKPVTKSIKPPIDILHSEKLETLLADKVSVAQPVPEPVAPAAVVAEEKPEVPEAPAVPVAEHPVVTVAPHEEDMMEMPPVATKQNIEVAQKAERPEHVSRFAHLKFGNDYEEADDTDDTEAVPAEPVQPAKKGHFGKKRK